MPCICGINRVYFIQGNNKSQAMHTIQDMFQDIKRKNEPDLDITGTEFNIAAKKNEFIS